MRDTTRPRLVPAAAPGGPRAPRRAAGSIGAVLATTAGALLLCASLANAEPAQANGHAPGDPLERCNRAIFTFNDTLDTWLFEPVAKGWNFVFPRVVQEHVDNFFDNLRFPIVFVNSALQAKHTRAGIAFARFSINTLFGLGGIFDTAGAAGLKRIDEDFGQTLGYWGVKTGPYLVLPLLGPSNPRDTVGLVADSFTRVWPYFVDRVVVYTATGINLVNTRALYLDVIHDAKEESLDYYAAVRDAYQQRRQALVEDRSRDEGSGSVFAPPSGGGKGGSGSKASEDDLYFPEDAE